MKQKLFFGQQQIKSILILLYIFLLAVGVSALELSVSSYKLNFSGPNSEKICKNITLSSDNNILTCQDRWTGNNFSKDIADYKTSAKMLGINISYIKNFIVEKKFEKIIEICISGEKAGRYYGVLLCNSGRAGVGSWLNVEIKKTEKTRVEKIKLTGAVIGDFQSSWHVILLIIFTFILIFVFIFMINRLRKLRNL